VAIRPKYKSNNQFPAAALYLDEILKAFAPTNLSKASPWGRGVGLAEGDVPD